MEKEAVAILDRDMLYPSVKFKEPIPCGSGVIAQKWNNRGANRYMHVRTDMENTLCLVVILYQDIIYLSLKFKESIPYGSGGIAQT